jgi:AcrR family transcriptional regulator
MKNRNSEKNDYILKIALTIFLRFGYRKTSMDDIAKAAGITRQGLYFHFQNKEEILKESVRKALKDSMQSATDALNENAPLEIRLFHALDAWFGLYVGLFGLEISDWDFQCRQLLSSEIDDSNLIFYEKLKSSLIQSTNIKSQDKIADTIVEILCTCGQSWKRSCSTHEQFAKKIQETIHLLLKSL